MFSVYAEKQVCVGETKCIISCILNGNADAVQFLTLDDVAAGFEAACLAFASRTPEIVLADNVRPANKLPWLPRPASLLFQPSSAAFTAFTLSQVEFRMFLREVFFVICADDSALLASLPSLESADVRP
jgi:hypothetical protein